MSKHPGVIVIDPTGLRDKLIVKPKIERERKQRERKNRRAREQRAVAEGLSS